MILFGMYTLHMVNATTSKAWLLCDNAAQEPLHPEMPKETLEKEDSNPMRQTTVEDLTAVTR